MKSIYVSIFFLVTGAQSLMAQTTLLKWNYLSPIVNTLNLAVETTHSEESSTQIRVFYLGYDGVRGFGINPEFRYYLSESPAPNGTFVAPYVRYMRFSDGPDIVNIGEVGFVLGRQRVYKEKISLEAYLGPGYGFGSSTNDFNLEGPVEGGFTIRAGLTIGFALNKKSSITDRPGTY
jgi:hypothetical protein